MMASAIGDCSKRFFAIIDGNFIFGDLIEALITQNDWLVDELTISTLSMSNENVDSLVNLIEGGFVKKINLVVSDYFYSHERRGLMPYIYEQLDVDNMLQVASAGIHTKITLIKTACGKRIVMHGSANLRSSGNIEQVMIEDSPELFDCNNQWHQAILDKYKTINKSIRRGELWQVVQTKGEAEKAAAEQQPKSDAAARKKHRF